MSEKLLNRMGATSQDDPHAGCTARWLEEREKRERAERSIVQNAEAYQRIAEGTDREIERLRFWRMTWAVAFGLAVLVLLAAAVAAR